MKTKFIYVIMAVLLMGSQMTLSAQNTDNKQKKQRPTPEHEKSRQGWAETMENPPSERRQKAQIGAETTPICA